MKDLSQVAKAETILAGTGHHPVAEQIKENVLMSHNQKILAKLIMLNAVTVARRGPQQSPHEQLMVAVEGAIADARRRRDALVAQGDAGSQDFLRLNEQIAGWESAWRNNR